MFKSRITICCLLIAGSNLFAYNPGQRAAIQDLTRAISQGKISESEARKKAVSFKIADKDLNDPIVNALIITADSKGIQDVANPTLVSTITSVKSKVPTSTIMRANGEVTQGYAAEEEEKGEVEELLQQLIDTEENFIQRLKKDQTMTAQQIDAGRQEIRNLIAGYANKKFGYKLNKKEEKLYQQHTKNYDIYTRLADEKYKQLTKPAEKPAPQPQPAVEKPAPMPTPQPVIDKTELKELEQKLKNAKVEYEALLTKIQQLIDNSATEKVTDNTMDLINDKRKNLRLKYEPLLEQMENIEKSKKYSADDIAAIKALYKEIDELTDAISSKMNDLTLVYQENETAEKGGTPTTTAGTPPSTTTTQPAAIPADVQKLIETYKNKNLSPLNNPNDFNKLLRNALGRDFKAEGEYAAYHNKSAEDIKKDLANDVAIKNLEIANIVVTYLRLLATKAYVGKYRKEGLAVKDVEDALQQFLSRQSPAGTYFVQLLEKNKDTYLDPAKVAQVLSGPSPDRFQQQITPPSVKTQTQPAAPNLVDTYFNKKYTPAEIDTYYKALKRTVVRISFDKQDNAGTVADAINARIKQAKDEYGRGAVNEQRITEILLPAYYDVKDMIIVALNEKSGKPDFQNAEIVAKNALRDFLSYNPVQGQNLAYYVDKFEKDVDAGKIPTTTPTIIVTTQPQPKGTSPETATTKDTGIKPYVNVADRTYTISDLQKYENLLKKKGLNFSLFEGIEDYKKADAAKQEKEVENLLIQLTYAIQDPTASFDQKLYKTVLPEYYRVKQMLAIHPFPKGQELLNKLLQTELKNPSGFSPLIKDYIADFEDGAI